MVVDNLLRIVSPSLHNNGDVDVNTAGLAWFGCHGSDVNVAPPADTQGNNDTLEVTVGAHQAHLGASSWHQEVLCEDCHLVPVSVADQTRIFCPSCGQKRAILWAERMVEEVLPDVPYAAPG